MKFDAKKNAVPALAATGSAVVSGLAANYGMKQIPEKFQKFAPWLVALLGMGMQLTDNVHVKNIGLGLGVMGVLKGASVLATPAEGAEPTSLQTNLKKFVPGLSGADDMESVRLLSDDVVELGNAGREFDTFDDFDDPVNGLMGVAEGNTMIG